MKIELTKEQIEEFIEMLEREGNDCIENYNLPDTGKHFFELADKIKEQMKKSDNNVALTRKMIFEEIEKTESKNT